MSVRGSFVDRFGEDQAAALEAAAAGHENGVHDKRGSDPFKWALAITIGYKCWSNDSYRQFHGITAPAGDVRQWIIDHGELGSHDGDVDFLGAVAGVYDDYLTDEVSS